MKAKWRNNCYIRLSNLIFILYTKKSGSIERRHIDPKKCNRLFLSVENNRNFEIFLQWKMTNVTGIVLSQSTVFIYREILQTTSMLGSWQNTQRRWTDVYWWFPPTMNYKEISQLVSPIDSLLFGPFSQYSISRWIRGR